VAGADEARVLLGLPETPDRTGVLSGSEN